MTGTGTGRNALFFWLVALGLVAGCRQPQPPPPIATTTPRPDPPPVAIVPAEIAEAPPRQALVRCAEPAPTQAVSACESKSAQLRDMGERIQALDDAVRALADDADPAETNAQICALLAHPCMAVVRALDPRAATEPADSALAVRAFWERGGRWWFENALRLAGTGANLWLPPKIRPTLAVDTTPDHRLRPLLCALGDRNCGRETRGWLNRARRYLAQDSMRRRASGRDDWCRERAAEQPDNARLRFWHHCVSQHGRTQGLPLGRFREPERGWIVIRGRRGHYAFCDEIRAYDLRTGSAYVAQSCAGLFDGMLGEGESFVGVTHGKRAYTGRVSTANLREFALLLALAPDVVSDAIPESGKEIPAGFVQTKVDPRTATGRGRVVIWSSDQTSLPYAYVRDDEVLATGSLTWPEDHNSAIWQHVVDLLRVVEDGLVEGCPSAELPEDLPIGTSPDGVSAIDAEPEYLRVINTELRDAIAGLRARPLCR